jgi:DNA (cytosine-5)-methyltransferase 1
MEELIVDSFAGGGGASQGIEEDLGRSPDIAINHDAEAIVMHEANHPGTKHYRSNIWSVSPDEACGRAPVGLAWFSPDCKHFSKAKGGKPVAHRIRDLAWIVVRWAKEKRPRVIILENVEEFADWGPLLESGMPCPERRGLTFRRWVAELRRYGYKVEWRELRACDYGTPTTRKRLFLIARCDGEPIVWPAPTHGPGLRPYRTAAEIIDWTQPCHSIFLSREEGRAVGVKRPLADATMARIAKGVQRYVIDAASPFIVNLTHQGSDRVEPIDGPLKTVTGAQRGEKALVTPFLVPRYGERPTQEPRTHAIDDAKCSHQQVVAAHLLSLKGSDRRMSPVDEPAPTITAGGFHVAEVRAFLMKYYGTAIGQGVDEPLDTVTARARFGLVMVQGELHEIVDIGMRMLTPRELFRAQGFPDTYDIEPMFEGKPMTKTAQIRMCGNSVCPPMARVLVAANYTDRQRKTAAA